MVAPFPRSVYTEVGGTTR